MTKTSQDDFKALQYEFGKKFLIKPKMTKNILQE